jgi:serine/threonine protein kinase
MKVVVTVTEGPARGQSFTFDQPDIFLFGRAKDARVSLPNDPFVSRHHFLLEISPPNCRITDLDSKNGTFVDGLRYGGRKPLEPGARQAPDNVTAVTLSKNGEVVVGDTKMQISVEIGEAVPASENNTIVEQDDSLPEGSASPERLTVAEAQQTSVPTIAEDPAQEQPERNTGIPTLINKTLTPEKKTVESKSKFDDEWSDALKSDSQRMAAEAQFPEYRVQRILGRGGMGIVYRAKNLKSGRIVAIKSLLPNRAISFTSYRVFCREIEVTRQLKHANIVELIETGSIKGAYYCVLEFVDGMDLRALTKENNERLPLNVLAPIMLGALDGLAFAHHAKIMLGTGRTGRSFTGVVHRDLKPENILLQRDGENWIPKIADFGLAKSFESAGMSDMTMDGVCGTPIYWPREQITHYRYLHPATDVFSMASIFYEILTGDWARPGLRKVYEQCKRRGTRPQIADFMRVIGANPIPPIRDIEPSIPIPVATVIDRALQETEVPNDQAQMREILQRLRYPDAGVFRDELARALKYSGILR